MTLDGDPQEGGVLSVALAEGERLQVRSDSQGRASLSLPRDRFARVYPSLPSFGLNEAQIELREGEAPPELHALCAQAVVEVGEGSEDLPPPLESEGEEDDFDEIQVSCSPGTKRLHIAFCSGAPLRGRVLDAEGRPEPGARVYLGHSFESSGPNTTPGVLSDGEGRFMLQLGARAALLNLKQVRAESLQGSGAGAPARIPGVGRVSFEALTIKLHPGETLRGRVTDLAGEPLQARVVAIVDSFLHKSWTSNSDANGMYWFGALAPPGSWVRAELEVSCPGYASQTIEVSQSAGGPACNLRLAPLVICRGRVLSAAGQPVAGASVVTLFDPHQLGRRYGLGYTSPDEDALASSSPKTDATGAFEFVTPAGPRLLVVSAEGHGERVLLTSLEEDSLEIRLQPAGVIAGSLRTSEGEPIAGRLLILLPTGYVPHLEETDSASQLKLSRGPSRYVPTAEVPTAASATLSGPSADEGRFRFSNVPPGRYDLYSRKKEWNPPRLLARDLAAGALDVSVVLEPARRSRLRFVAKNRGGAPLMGAPMFFAYGASGELLALAYPDEEGQVEIELSSFGPILIEASDQGFRTLQRRLKIEPGRDQSLEPFVLDERVGAVVVSVHGQEAFNYVEISGRDPVSKRWVDADRASRGEPERMTFPPGLQEIRVRAYGKDDEVLKEVVRKVLVRLRSPLSLSIDLARD